MGRRALRVEFQRARGCGACFLEILLLAIELSEDLTVAVGNPGPRTRVTAIQIDRLPKELLGKFEVSARSAVEKVHASQVEIEGIRVSSITVPAPPELATHEPDLEGFNDAACDVVLDLEDIHKLPVVALGPELVAIPRIDQLNGDPQSSCCLSNAALQDRTHAQALSDLARVGRQPPELEARCARCDAQTANPRQAIEQLLCEPFTEVLLIALGADVRERQHRERWDVFVIG